MYQKLSWLWPVSVVIFLCIPLFVGLGRGDLRGDEAIYSFGVDHILDSGDWLVPKSSPDVRAPFLEKPPLKFWIVAAPIYFGLLPHDEFGLRFWDALFGSLAFLYVFWIARRLSTALGGFAAALVLAVHAPLVFEHGLRSNNMEAALVLSYCGGVAHFLAWSSSTAARPRRLHALAAALFFVLGFMTKFVAAIFLPLVIGLAVVVSRGYRRKVAEHWRDWAAAAALAAVLIAPWFVFAQIRFGADLWRTILGEHVFVRFTKYLDPTHVHPWYYYFTTLYQGLVESNTAMVVGAGLVILTVQTVRRRCADGLVVLVWGVVPLCLISFGTSKLYHYAYPFVPPFAIAGGIGVSWAFGMARLAAQKLLSGVDEFLARWLEPLRPVLNRPVVHAAILAGMVGAAIIAGLTYYSGPLRLNLGGMVVKNSSMWRPLLIGVVCAILGGSNRRSSVAIGLFVVWILLPSTAYADQLARLNLDTHPMRSARDCVLRVQAESPPGPPGIVIHSPSKAMGHPLYYYFMSIRPWVRRDRMPSSGLSTYMYDAAELRPALTLKTSFEDFILDRDAEGGPHAGQVWPTVVPMMDEIVLMLPKEYAACEPSFSAAKRQLQ